MTDEVSVIDNALVYAHDMAENPCWTLTKLARHCRGNPHDGAEGENSKAKAMPSCKDGHRDKLSRWRQDSKIGGGEGD